ncbi:MAG TPA: FtsX-like permease family protein [Burkholderiaceae bacterium]|nr:FtsX-like permease family protein [Burkholderiaceae bacterium]
MNDFKIGARNLARNARRSAVTIMAIAVGFAAVLLFAGYTHDVYAGLMRQAIHGELLGHLTVTKRGLETAGRIHPAKYLFSASDLERARRIVEATPHVTRVAPRLLVYGLASNGRASTIFLGEGIDPKDMQVLRGPRLADASGALDAARPTGVTLSQGLAEILHLKAGDGAAMLVSTLAGQANALDVDVIDTFSTGNAATNDKFAFVPLGLAQSLYDAEGYADRITIVLDDLGRIGEVRAAVAARLAQAGFDVTIRDWQDLSVFYRQVRGMFDMIFAFIFAIVFIVVVMSIANAMSMSVVERTREIGTLRAIGLRRAGVVRLFAAESLLLALAGCLGGLLLTVALRTGINAADINYVPPNSTDPVPLTVGFEAARALQITLLMCALGVAAALLPARRAARQPIIDSLGHV